MVLFLYRVLQPTKLLAWMIACCIGIGLTGTAGFCAATAGATNLSAQEKQNLVQKAVAQYEQGQTEEAREGLKKASAVFPENYAVPYYLGLIYLEQGDRKEAIAQWKQYVKLDPRSENSIRIRKHLTLLIREHAREFAKH